MDNKLMSTPQYGNDQAPQYTPPYVTEQPKPWDHLAKGTQPSFGPTPAKGVLCPVCNARQSSVVKHEIGTTTHTFGVLLCCVAPGCCCLPYFIDSCQNSNHYCSVCDTYLGTFKS